MEVFSIVSTARAVDRVDVIAAAMFVLASVINRRRDKFVLHVAVNCSFLIMAMDLSPCVCIIADLGAMTTR